MPTGTARVTTLGELDEAMKSARASKSGAYIEIIGGKMDMPPALASYAARKCRRERMRSRDARRRLPVRMVHSSLHLRLTALR